MRMLTAWEKASQKHRSNDSKISSYPCKPSNTQSAHMSLRPQPSSVDASTPYFRDRPSPQIPFLLPSFPERFSLLRRLPWYPLDFS